MPTNADDIISVATYKTYAGISHTNDDALIQVAVTAVSKGLVHWARRAFVSSARTEYHDGKGHTLLRTRAIPITEITRIACARDTALSLSHPTANRAYLKLSATTLTLVDITNGTSTSSTFTVSNHATITDLATAIGTTSWSASVLGEYGGWPATDLKTIQYASATDSPAYVAIYSDEAHSPVIDEVTGTIEGIFPAGFQNVRIDYTAGYTAGGFPDDLQTGVCMAVAGLVGTSKRDPTMESETIGDYSYRVSKAASGDFSDPVFSPAVSLLGPYRRITL